MAEERRLDQAIVKVDGTRLPAELYALMSLVQVEESVHLPDAFTLRFDDPHFELFDRMTFKLGAEVEIAFAAEGEAVVVTTGEVTAVAVEQGAGGRHELVVSGIDATHRLARGPKSRSFIQMTDADIVARVADDHGLDNDIDATGEVLDYALQSSQSDYAFLRQRASRIGFDLWMADNKLHFKPKPEAAARPPVLTWGTNLHKFKVRFSSAERCDELTVRGWDPVAKSVIVGRADEGDPGTTAPAAEELSRAARAAFGTARRFAGQFPVRTQSEADALARSLLLRASGDEVIARGEATGDPMIAAGAMLEIREVGQKLSGIYRATSVEHLYGAGTPYVTRFTCGGKDAAGLADLVRAGGMAGGVDARGWGGLVIGVVTNIDDPERLGRVKVKFPTLTDQDESTWAKVVSPGAGKARGLQCLPEVHDEVLVGFEHGDVRCPLVLGGLWNGEDPPPRDLARNGKVLARWWASRRAHSIALDDDDRAGAVRLSLGDADSSLTIQKADTVLAGEQKVTIRGQEVEIAAHRKLVLRADRVEIAGDGEVRIAGRPIRLN